MLRLDKATLGKIAAYRTTQEAKVLQVTRAELAMVDAAVQAAEAAGDGVVRLDQAVVAASAAMSTPALHLQGGRYTVLFDVTRVPGGRLNRHLSVSKRRDGRAVAMDETDVQALRRLFGFPPSAVLGAGASPGSLVVHILEVVPEAEA